jgi:type IV secretory pathway ATPase VirB11/archaellum biosynthesis ATPase
MSDQHDEFRPRRDADKGREPQFVSAQIGGRMISLAALAERIEAAFVEEHGTDSPELREADTPAKRLKLVLATTDYLLSVESVQIASQAKADLIARVYSDLFSYGPLDPYFLDPRVTSISLEGVDRAAVRYEQGELTALGPIFTDVQHFRRVINRLLMDAGAELREDQPVMEFGLMAGDRRISVNLAAPPVTTQLTADIRVHPAALPTWDALIEQGMFTEQSAVFLKALAASPHGLLIVGEPVSGKTMLLSLLASVLPVVDNVVAVERAGELFLPPGVQRLVAQWTLGSRPGITFGEQIAHALERQPTCLLLDEVRADEPLTIAPLLQLPNPPRQIWSFRGAIFTKRLQNALGMLARRAEVGAGETLIRALYERLPFVLTVNRVGGRLRLWSIGEWQFRHSPDYPTYTALMQIENGELRLTGERPARPLDLPPAFWE